MMKNAMELANAKVMMEEKLGKTELANILRVAKLKIDEIKKETGVDELTIIKTNMNLAPSPESKLVWALCVGE